MTTIRKSNMLATAILPSLYDKLISVSKEKGFSLSELVLMSVAMQLNRKNYKFKKIGRTSEKKKIITVRVSEGLSHFVDIAAKEYGCSRSKFISTAIEYGLNYASKG